MSDVESEAPESRGSEKEASRGSGYRLFTAIPRNVAIILGILILGMSTPIAWIQRSGSLPNFGLQLKRSYWLLEPLTVPADSDLPFFESKILAVSHNEKSLWIGGKSGLLAHSEDQGKTWTFLHFYGDRWSDASQINRTSQLPTSPQPDVLAIDWSQHSPLLLTSDFALYSGIPDGSFRVADQRAMTIPTEASSNGAERSQSHPVTVAGLTYVFDASGKLNPVAAQTFASCADLARGLDPNASKANTFIQASPKCVIRPSPLFAWTVENSSNSNAVWELRLDLGQQLAITASRRAEHFTRSIKLPPPWYFALTLPIGVVLLLFAGRSETFRPEEGSIANVGVSDRPLESEDEDYLGWRRMARGISLFLRNKNRGAPLVLAITGPWGSGKSSLMNLLRADLKGVSRTVWFNAWHHESEDQLLAALFQAVRNQALESVWTFRGATRRVQLMALRYRTMWPLVITLVVSSIGCIWVIAKAASGLALKSQEALLPALLTEWGLLLSSTAALVGILKTIYDKFGKLIANPSSLLASTSGSVSIKDLDAQITFRQRFSEDFDSVTRLLRKRRLVIIIDDLDRCRPEKIREVLEAINFLVSSGKCFVVLGMARMNVEYFLGYSFKDVLDEVPPALLGVSADADPSKINKRVSYARLYLDKLIQIEIPVPKLEGDGARRMILGGDADLQLEDLSDDDRKLLSRLKKQQSRIRKGMLQVGQWSVPVLGGIFLAVFLSWPLNHLLNSWKPGETHASQDRPSALGTGAPPAQQDANPAAAGNVAGGNRPAPGSAPAPSTTALPLSLPTVDSPEANAAWPVYSGFGLVVLLFTASCFRLIFTAQVQLLVDDSAGFKRSLGIWAPMIYHSYPSPRSVKRFLNKVRFIAMRQRGLNAPDPITRLDRFAEYLSVKFMQLRRRDRGIGDLLNKLHTPTPNAMEQELSERALVALVVLESNAACWERLDAGKQLDAMPENFLQSSSELDAEIGEEEISAMTGELSEIWNVVTRGVDKYRILSGGLVSASDPPQQQVPYFEAGDSRQVEPQTASV